MAATRIEWTEVSWNPLTGCSKISSGCKNCYAERMATRLKAMGSPNYVDGFELRCHEHLLELPLKWKQPRHVFVNSMSDLFHEDVPLAFIQKTFSVMALANQHTFQILTKRAVRLSDVAHQLEWTPNIWMGVSIEDNNYSYRADYLRRVPAFVRFLSCEPLIGPLPSLSLERIQWVIVGGESGPNARPMQEDWVVYIKDLCRSTDTPFFFKQWGGVNKKKNGRKLDGRYWSDMPTHALSAVAMPL